MKPVLAIFLLLVTAPALAQNAPTEWVDPATGHRVIRLSDDEGGASLYFHQNSFSPDGTKFIFNTREGIVAVDISKLGEEPVKRELVVPQGNAIVAAFQTPEVYYRSGRRGPLSAANLETKETRVVYDGPGSVINADGTLVVHFERDDDAASIVEEKNIPMLVTGEFVKRGERRGRMSPGERSLAMVVTDIKTGESKKIHYSTEWLNHLQASPADPRRMLFCHEGTWHEVDRVWTIKTDGSALKLMHKRTMPYEIAGHEFFSHDGEWVWYDLQTPRSKEFWLSGVNIESGERLWYPIKREEWSVHYNISRDGTLFAGDGGGPGSVANHTKLPERRRLDPPGNGQWIYAFHPTGEPKETREVGGETINIGTLKSERLVDLSDHDYDLEPNVHITPDNKWVIFRSNMHGRTHVYAAEVTKGE